MPTCRAQIIFTPSSTVVVGPHLSARRIERRIDEPAIGVSLESGALAAVLGVSGRDLVDTTADLDDGWPSAELPEALAQESDEGALTQLEGVLAAHLRLEHKDETVLAATGAIRRGSPAAVTLARLGVDRRTFVPRFREMVGTTPKHFERICRFNRAIRAIRQADAAPLATIAADHGYADQAHLSREVKDFAQTTPSSLHRDGSTNINHLAGDKFFKTVVS